MKFLSTLESTRGILASVIANAFSQFLIYITSKTQIQNKDFILYIITFAFANILSYSLDILLAKENFDGNVIPVTDIKTRALYLLDKMFSYQLVKFFIVVCIDIIVVSAIFKKIRQLLDRKNIKFKNRDQLLMVAITLTTFLIYGNMIRFQWVYSDDENVTLDILIISWLTILLVIELN